MSSTVPLLHRFLGIGLVLVAAAFVGLRYLGIPPLSLQRSVALAIASTLSMVGIVLVVVAVFILKPRVPDRSPGQSVEQYWSTPEVGTRVLPVWFSLEGAGMLAAIGYLLTGEIVSGIAMGLTIAAFWACGPNLFAKT
jgi:hypothetical protein